MGQSATVGRSAIAKRVLLADAPAAAWPTSRPSPVLP